MVFLLAFSSAAAQLPDDAAAQIADAEKQFTEAAKIEGTRAAFLRFLADDAIVFNPAPVNGKQSWTKRIETGASLSWRPAFAAGSKGGDFGYDTGPWEWKKSAADPGAQAWGYFVSVWKKQANGAWKVVLDFGSDNPQPAGEAATAVELHPPETAAPSDGEAKAAARAFQDAQRRFTEAAKNDSTNALLELAVDDLRVLRQGVFPAIGREAAAVMLSVQRGKMSLTPGGGGMSPSADIAYTYGKYSVDRGVSSETGYYLQIWRTDSKGGWRIALDLEKKLLPNEKKSE